MAEVDSKDLATTTLNDHDRDFGDGQVIPADGHTMDDGMRRALKSRHLLMIALGGVIGPGTFYATGFALEYSGPVGSLIGYIIIGINVFLVTQVLGEMATLFPSTGSFNEFAGRFVDPALSFALGWNYWYMWVSIIIRFETDVFRLVGLTRKSLNRARFWLMSTTAPPLF